MHMDPNSSAPIGSPFDNVDGIQDLVFQFAIVEDTLGDFNQDGIVDGLDFLDWQINPALGDLSDWEANYGTQYCNCGDELLTGKVLYSPLVSLGSVSAVAAVPEPGAVGLMLVGISVLCGTRQRPMPKVC
jgi:hypothetical protein